MSASKRRRIMCLTHDPHLGVVRAAALLQHGYQGHWALPGTVDNLDGFDMVLACSSLDAVEVDAAVALMPPTCSLLLLPRGLTIEELLHRLHVLFRREALAKAHKAVG